MANKLKCPFISFLFGALISITSPSAISQSDIQGDIAVLGAIPNGSEDGSVPAWTGGLSRTEKTNKHHIDPFGDDEPLFIIDSNNYQQHKERLSEGLIALLETYPDSFKIPVYPSHRSASFPAWYFQNTKNRNPELTHLSDDGNAINNPIAGVNFPSPKNGIEAIWNHLTRWRGRYVIRESVDAIVYKDGSQKLFKARQEASFEPFRYYQEPIPEKKTKKPVLLYYSSTLTEPPKLAGGALLAVDFIDQQQNPRQSWTYDVKQRRVKRLPHISYDDPAIMAESLRTADDTDIYSGSPDRYEWKLEPRRIMYIPYNSYRLSDPTLSYDSILTPHHLKPEFTRFEAHRVWKVTATLRPGQHHAYAKRVLYLDEDTWTIALADQFDQKGAIWRVSIGFLKNFYEVPLTFTSAEVFHDLKTHNYNAIALTNEEKSSGEYDLEPPPTSYFSPASFRSRVTR